MEKGSRDMAVVIPVKDIGDDAIIEMVSGSKMTVGFFLSSSGMASLIWSMFDMRTC